PLERDADDAVAADPKGASSDPVDPVRTDKNIGLDPLDGDPAVPHFERADLHTLPEVGARLDRLLDEEVVETLPLRHVDERIAVPAGQRFPVAQAQVDGRHDML